jgi:sialate O-acetylesterase
VTIVDFLQIINAEIGNNQMKIANFLIAAALSACAANAAQADVRLPGMFSNAMVLQQGIPLPVWGWADPGEQVTVVIANQKAFTTADNDGKWRVTLEPLKADEKPLAMTVGGHNTIVIKDVLVGEVWLCGGQSNMAMPVRNCFHFDDEQAAANLPQIRLYHASRPGSPEPQIEHDGHWSVCSPQTVGNWTATGFFFGRHLHKELGVPIGLIDTSRGGMPIRTFMSRESFGLLPTGKNDYEELQKLWRDYVAHRADRDAAVVGAQELERKRHAWLVDQDQREENPAAAAAPDADISGWTAVSGDKIQFPTAGIYWVRKQIEIPKEWLDRELEIGPFTIADVDQPYASGKLIHGGLWINSFGEHGGRWYHVPARFSKTTTLTLALRILNVTGHPGLQLTSTTALRPREPSAGEHPILLGGEWRMRQAVAIEASDLPLVPAVDPVPGSKAGEPGALYNSSIYPLAPFAVRGAIWYQGEADSTKTQHYAEALPALIANWRSLWGQGEFPFGIVQLPNRKPRQTVPIEHGWPEFREVQARVAQTVPNAGIAVTIDIGDAVEGHPRNKQDVGKRLALWALANTYGKEIPNWSSPLYRSLKIDGRYIRVIFDHAAGGLKAENGAPAGFAIAGTDKIFHFATAKIDGDSVVVSSDKVQKPVAVRYAWAENPVGNLFNQAGLPVMPFRTDDWDTKEVKSSDDEKLP